MTEPVDTLNKAGEAAKAMAGDAGVAFNTVASGCSSLWDAFGQAWDLMLSGRLGDAYAALAGPTGTCYDSVVASLMGLFPFLS